MTQYTITFDRDEEGLFNRVLERLDPGEYTILEPVKLLKPEDPRYSERQAVIEMDPEACLTFRLGMKNVRIRRQRTEEELAEEKEINDRHTVKVTVFVPPTTNNTP